MKGGRTGAEMAVLAAGFGAGVLLERILVRREVRPHSPADALPTLDDLRAESVTCADGVVLAVREKGSANAGLTVVFVHGYTVTAESWALQVRDLDVDPSAVRLVLYDQRGHGESGVGPRENDTIEQLGSDLAEVLIQRVPRGPVVLVGHSMGGMTIMALAEQQPGLFGDKVVAAALIDTSSGGMGQASLGLPAAFAALPGRLLPYASRTTSLNRRAERFRAVDSDLGRWINTKLSFGPGASEPAQAAMTHMQAPMTLETMTAFLPTFALHERTALLTPLRAIPTLIMVGERDVLTPPSHSRTIAEMLPDARLVTVPGSGHMVMLEAPEAVTQALEELIRSVL